ncbi:hypothetical protein BUALT_Bualt12G0013800 [Buddleja alternifolia]|uniref:ARM repeat superfamily protein n=1 Tax=Buddleja alternifolia TaxID=168488 RepID=A0AAV6WP33_9LAMI|nr:hypothetical protein BUALT_Bualt12G0013800 [Buddleja alternifolia]
MEKEEDHHQLIGGLDSGPMVSATLARVINTLLNAKPKKLNIAISQLNSPPKIAPLTGIHIYIYMSVCMYVYLQLGLYFRAAVLFFNSVFSFAFEVSLEQSLWFLNKYIAEAAERDESLDQVLVPIIQHTLVMRKSKQENQSLIILNWLFQDEILFQAIMSNLTGILSRRDDHYVALGWCILGRSVIEYENIANNLATNGIREKYDVILKMFCSCVAHLLSIICNGSNMQDGFELPTRLSVAATDFILSLTVALTKKDMLSNNITKKQKPSSLGAKNQPITLLPAATTNRDENTVRKASELPSSLELKLLLWNNLNELTTLVKKLTAWSRKSRSLHAKGLERVSKWLQEIKQQYGCFLDEAESQMLKTGSLLLSSCWKHYGMLMHLEDHKFSQHYKELLNQYLSGIQFYTDNQAEEPNMNKNSRAETINFFLNCLMLLLGRLNNEQFGSVITEFGSQISQVVMSQLRCSDEEVIDGAISILKAAIFLTNHTLSKSSLGDNTQMDSLLPILLNLLDERDAAAKAVVKLVAEYCSICPDSKCLHKVLKGIGSKNLAQRRNAFDIVAELIHICSISDDTLSQVAWLDVVDHLLQCLEDEDQIIQNQAANLVPMIDPPLVLPALVGLSYSTRERVQISASSALIALLINHKHKPKIVCLLLDCLSKLSQNPDSGAPTGSKEGSTLDADRLLKLLPEWAKSVEDWNVMVGPLIDKMLAEPSNAIIVRFLSHISEYLAEAVDLVFHRLILYMSEPKEIDDSFSKLKERTDTNSETMKHEQFLFTRLCPLLVIRLLPLRVFDDINSPLVYGEFPRNSSSHDEMHVNIVGTQSIAALMINRALSKSEFEDVRKLAAELCGRIHPEVLIPILSSLLESAANVMDVFKIKVCLFSFCTSLMIRGSNAYKHPDLLRIRKTIQKILLWKSMDKDEISKAQHGCIDCLALILCTELQDPETSKGEAISTGSVLAYVIEQLTDDKNDNSFESDGGDRMSRLSFQLCMANVLISTCQKISNAGKKSFVKKIIPCLIRSIGTIVEPEIRAACIQVLFSVAYHLKSFILPYSNDLLRVALISLKEGPEKEKMAGAKLLACLMASEEEVVESISRGLLEARTLLQNLTSTDPSSDVRQMCQQLLVCLTSH